jgi:hypothetical protein
MSYFPELSAIDVKEIILESSIKYTDKEVNMPGAKSSIPFGQLSTTGGIVNVYAAVQLAEKWNSKKKKKERRKRRKRKKKK